MKNVQITVDEETLSMVDAVAGPLGLKRSQIVREALRDWLGKRQVREFEQHWIAALRRKPDDASRAESWTGSQAWSEK